MTDDLTPEQKLQRYRRAKEVLDGAGWVFDEFVNARMAEMLRTNPGDAAGRERLHRAASVATQLKIDLLREVETYNDEVMLQERREKMKEGQHGRRDHHLN